jgi:hypothetical protein
MRTLSTPDCRVPRLQYSMIAHISISTAGLWASASWIAKPAMQGGCV